MVARRTAARILRAKPPLLRTRSLGGTYTAPAAKYVGGLDRLEPAGCAQRILGPATASRRLLGAGDHDPHDLAARVPGELPLADEQYRDPPRSADRVPSRHRIRPREPCHGTRPVQPSGRYSRSLASSRTGAGASRVLWRRDRDHSPFRPDDPTVPRDPGKLARHTCPRGTTATHGPRSPRRPPTGPRGGGRRAGAVS